MRNLDDILDGSLLDEEGFTKMKKEVEISIETIKDLKQKGETPSNIHIQAMTRYDMLM